MLWHCVVLKSVTNDVKKCFIQQEIKERKKGEKEKKERGEKGWESTNVAIGIVWQILFKFRFYYLLSMIRKNTFSLIVSVSRTEINL